jgi:phosphoglycerol transferase MdoB-like AlkP superfamily enzyme
MVIAGHGRPAMPSSLAAVIRDWGSSDLARRHGPAQATLILLINLAALALMVWSETNVAPKVVFCLTWGLLNFFWLAVLRRPLVAAALSLATVVVLILLSRLKYKIIWTTANFLDVWIVNSDTVDFLLSVKPDLFTDVMLALLVLLPGLGLLWWIDNLRVRLRTATGGFALCLTGIAGMAAVYPEQEWEAFFSESYVSRFSRSGITALSALAAQGYLDSDESVTEQLKLLPEATCTPSGKPPHIILVHDESSFDARVLPGVKVPTGYGRHFRSFDGHQRRFIVEGAGGPSWYAEYNVLAGLSARSFGRFAYYVTQIAAGRVERGLPTALRRCGYRTFSIYPALGAFMSAKSFQTTTGIQSFTDQGALGTNRVEPDRFYFDAALRTIERQHAGGPMFMFVYLAQNHWPWSHRWRPDLLPGWQDPGNQPNVDEYLRRQTMTAHDYRDFLSRLRGDFPGESFLLVRYGDHQPDFASWMLEPGIDETGISQRLMSYDPRYYSTYYAIDAVNFRPASTASALDTIEGPYLPLIVQEAAGLPLDPSFVEQKKILQRCKGLFYTCAGGAEARRFNRQLIDAGLIKGL